MKTVAAIIAALCLVQVAHAGVKSQLCPEEPTTRCSALAGLQITVSQGKCKGFVKAKCKAWSESQSVYKEAIKEWWSDPEKVCDFGSAEAAAQAVATASASVWTSALVDVKCTDKRGNKACGWSLSNGATLATSQAEAWAQAAADASTELSEEHAESGDDESEDPGAVAEAFCFTDVRSIGVALVDVAAKASADACNDDENFGKVFDKQYIEATKTVIANAFAKATASTCAERIRKKGEAVTAVLEDIVASSECFGEGEVKSKTKKRGLGVLCSDDQPPRCTGSGARKCCGSRRKRKNCPIGRKDCPEGKCSGPWTRQVKTASGSFIYKKRNGKLCFCDPGAV